jgi:hypothetical protein
VRSEIKIEAFNEENLVIGNSKINYNSVKVNVISGIYGSNKPSLFFKDKCSRKLSSVNGGLIILNNLTVAVIPLRFT